MDGNNTTQSPSKNGPDVATELYMQTFWSKETAPERRMLVQTLFLPLIYTSLLMWACLSLFWGSLTANNDLSKLKVAVANLEGQNGMLGSSILDGVSSQKGRNSLEWQFHNTALAGWAEQLILDETVWAAVEISANATKLVDEALATGDPTYNPTNAVSLYYASARNQITVNSHVVPAVLSIINPTLSTAAGRHTATFLQKNTDNATVLETALHCPQCLANPFVLTTIDLVPFDSAVASGSTMVGMIFLLTFTFSIFQILRANGLAVGAKLRLSSTLVFRTVASLGAYFVMSLWYTFINRAFGVPMSGRFGEGAGFMVYWMLNWCTMAAVGLPMESLFTVVGMKWAGYFLSFWIIVNVAGAFNSFDIMPSFYQYGYAIPFYHSIQGVRTIVFGTKSHLGLNFGVLIAWSVVSIAGLSVFTFLRIRRNAKTGEHDLP